jgi:hypothetical protein
MGWRDTLLGDVPRQLAEKDIPPSMKIVLGPDITGTGGTSFYVNKTYFMTEYILKLKPTVGVAAACNAQVETYNLPLMPDLLCEFDCLDYDIPFEDKIRAWFVARTALRVWAWGKWIGRGYLAAVPVQSPAPLKFTLPILFTGIRVFGASSSSGNACKSYDGTTACHMYDVPFATDAGSVTEFQAYSTLFGGEMLP